MACKSRSRESQQSQQSDGLELEGEESAGHALYWCNYLPFAAAPVAVNCNIFLMFVEISCLADAVHTHTSNLLPYTTSGIIFAAGRGGTKEGNLRLLSCSRIILVELRSFCCCICQTVNIRKHLASSEELPISEKKDFLDPYDIKNETICKPYTDDISK